MITKHDKDINDKFDKLNSDAYFMLSGNMDDRVAHNLYRKINYKLESNAILIDTNNSSTHLITIAPDAKVIPVKVLSIDIEVKELA